MADKSSDHIIDDVMDEAEEFALFGAVVFLSVAAVLMLLCCVAYQTRRLTMRAACERKGD
ncbi:hypothetical protein BOX15_Mlig031499g1 [Macrostomum lignano]|nr:hypothetical protein BOX15_Mlig031499g1 [Macrostomum lignano]